LHEKSIIAIVTVIVTDFLAFVFSDTQKNEGQEYQIFVREFWRKIGVCVYTLYEKSIPSIHVGREESMFSDEPHNKEIL
jgi:hypothetical protein